MEPPSRIVVPLKEAFNWDIHDIGSKAKNLALLIQQDFRVPDGFSITTEAYNRFINANKLYHVIDMEVFRKPRDDMRWEEIWDASLRIRSAFLKAQIPSDIENQIISQINKLEYSSSDKDPKYSVRSSSPAEDSSETSFAGIHESYINVDSIEKILESVKLVWASLWSDRAILYREELKLDSINSSISVLIQIMEEQPISGLAFSQDPSGTSTHSMVIEAIEGLCSELVDNEKVPEKWIINRSNKEQITHFRPPEYQDSLLSPLELTHLMDNILGLEEYFGFSVDVEWTGKGDRLTILQTRPITSIFDSNQERQWYLTLTPSFANLKKLADKVEKELIPQLRADGLRLAKENPYDFKGMELALKIKDRADVYFKWKDIYWDDFIPFAHGIRNFGIFYNDLVKPENSYEFIEILKTDDLLASQRNRELYDLSLILNSFSELKKQLKHILNNGFQGKELLNEVISISSNEFSTSEKSKEYNQFFKSFKNLLDSHLDITYENRSLKDHPEIILQNIVQLSEKNTDEEPKTKTDSQYYLDKLYKSAGPSRKEEVDEVLRIARLSWKLRDDDNILLGKVENQLLKFLNRGLEILITEKRISPDGKAVLDDWEIIYHALVQDDGSNVVLKKRNHKETLKTTFKPRQLIGQPSSPGIVTGRARIINSFEDFSSLKSGEILVCDAIQPQMTFLVSLAAGIVERRGGMLVHSSIIAREMGIPAVNGVSNATQLIKNGDIVTVNGYLGLVIIGEAEFEMELHNEIAEQSP
jgi:phosphohistidine swiveling domain-containing protein